MLKQQLHEIIQANAGYAAITLVIEKDIQHSDILDVVIKQSAMQSLTFIDNGNSKTLFNMGV